MPRLPTPSSNGLNNNGVGSNHLHLQHHLEASKIIDTSGDHIPISPPSPLSLVAPRTRFASTPLSTRLRKSPSSSKASSPTDPSKRNGCKLLLGEDPVQFRVPEPLKRPGSAGNGFPRIAQSWRAGSVSKTYDCIERGKTSPVLSLAEQAKAVSFPEPLHRPDNPRAGSFTGVLVTAAHNAR